MEQIDKKVVIDSLLYSTRIDLGYGASGTAYDTDLKLDPFEGWIDEVYVWGRSLHESDLSQLLLQTSQSGNSTISHHALRRNEIDAQVNDDIHMTAMILLLCTLFCVACIRYQRRYQRYLADNPHEH